MEIDLSEIWKRQHWVLWLEGAKVAKRTSSRMGRVVVLDEGGAAALSARATLCSASVEEHAVNMGAPARAAAARSNCLLDWLGDALMMVSLTGRMDKTDRCDQRCLYAAARACRSMRGSSIHFPTQTYRMQSKVCR